jgi:hypothetical protein
MNNTIPKIINIQNIVPGFGVTKPILSDFKQLKATNSGNPGDCS